MIDSIGLTDLQHIVSLHVAKGKCLANIHEAKESVQSYQDALTVRPTRDVLGIFHVVVRPA